MDTLQTRRITDNLAHIRALESSPYADDVRVAFFTRYAIDRAGDGVLQVHRLASDVAGHIEKLLELMAPPPHARVLDVGCGVGDCASLMKALRSDLHFQLVNRSRAQLALCPPEFEQIEADMHSIPLPSASFDVAMYCYSLGHGLLERALPEAARVLKPGGVLFIYDVTSEDGTALDERLAYRAHAVRRVQEEADDAGFSQDFCLELPDLDVSHLGKVIGIDAAVRYFSGARPVIYRFRRRA